MITSGCFTPSHWSDCWVPSGQNDSTYSSMPCWRCCACYASHATAIWESAEKLITSHT